MTLWLIGMMGSGKTTVGRLAAKTLGVEFIDTDQEIAWRVGCSVAQLWGELGESAFRDMEKAAVARVAGLNAVVATGGGAPLDPGSREIMGSSGKVVWLRVSPAVTVERIGDPKDRPLLANIPSTEAAVRSLLEERADAYQSAADLIVDTDGHEPEDLAREVVDAWSQ
jgi:shikimate kinase